MASDALIASLFSCRCIARCVTDGASCDIENACIAAGPSGLLKNSLPYLVSIEKPLWFLGVYLGRSAYISGMSDLSSQIQTSAAQPAEGRDDAGSFKQHPLKDVIEADKHLANATAAASPNLPFRVAKFRPPGAV